MNSKDLRDLHESFSNIINEQVTSTTHDWKRGVDKAPAAPTLPPSPESRKRNQLPKRTAANAANVQYYKDDVDVFDLVKGHLMSEGYADTEEAALAIMANMSEEWRQSIVEDEQSSADAKERNRRTQDALDKRRSSDYVPPAPKLPPAPPEASDSKPRDSSPGSAPTPPRYRGDRAIDRRSSTPSIKPPTKQNRSMGGGNKGSTIGTIERGKSGDGFLGPTVKIGGRRIGIPNPSPIR